MKWEDFSVHFYSVEVPQLLRKAVEGLINANRQFNILDLGCGDGRLLFALQQNGLLNRARSIVGVDNSEVRTERLKQKIKNSTLLVSDACDVKALESNSFDMIICSQLVEHVPDDKLLLKEIVRLVKKDGCAYISSVIKKRYGFWIYRSGGQFRVDPTHVREYPSANEFVKLLSQQGLEPEEVAVTPVRYSILELMLRFLILLRIYPVEKPPDAFLEHKSLQVLRGLTMPVIGYSTIEVFCRVRPA